MNNGSLRLCYVQERESVLAAFFTDADLAYQWGDDWNDAPFEHNAGEPYTDWRDADGLTHPATIVRTMIEGPWVIAGHGMANSGYSVQMINNRIVPWISPSPEDYGRDRGIAAPDPIWAGSTLDEVITAVQETRGRIYLDLKALNRFGGLVDTDHFNLTTGRQN